MSDSLWSRVRQGMARTTDTSHIPLGAVVVIGGILSYRSHGMLRQDREMVVHTYQVIGTLHQTLLAVEEAETSQRGFVITGDNAFLVPYRKSKDQIIPAVEGDLTRLLVRNAAQRGRFDKLRSALNQEFQELQHTIDARRDQGFDAAQTIVKSRVDRQTAEQIRNMIAEMDGVEEHLLAERAQHVAASERRILIWGGITLALSLLVRLFLALRSVRQPVNASA